MLVGMQRIEYNAYNTMRITKLIEYNAENTMHGEQCKEYCA